MLRQGTCARMCTQTVRATCLVAADGRPMVWLPHIPRAPCRHKGPAAASFLEERAFLFFCTAGLLTCASGRCLGLRCSEGPIYAYSHLWRSGVA